MDDIRGMVDRFHAGNLLQQLGIMPGHVLEQFQLGIGRSGYQHCVHSAQRLAYGMQIGLILRQVTVIAGVGLVVQVGCAAARLHDCSRETIFIEGNHARLCVIDPDYRVRMSWHFLSGVNTVRGTFANPISMSPWE